MSTAEEYPRFKSSPVPRPRSYWTALLALFAAGAAQAVSFNAPNPSTAQTLPSYIEIQGGNCNGTAIVNPTGAVTNREQGLTLSGSGSMTSVLELHWKCIGGC